MTLTSPLTTSTAITQYVKAITDSNRKTGYEYQRRLTYFEKFVKENYHFTIDELTINKMFDINVYDLLQSYVSYMANMTNMNGHKVSSLTLKQRVITAMNFLEYHDIEISPRKFKLKVKLPKIVKRHKEALSKEDIIKLLETCTDIKLKTYLLFLAATGCRAAEGCAIRLMDIDFNRNTVFIRGEYTKTKQDRTVFMTNEVADQLKLWLDYKYRKRRIYSMTEHRNYYLTPKRSNLDLVFAKYQPPSKNDNRKKDEYKIITSLYVTLLVKFEKVLDQLGIGYEDITKRRRKITLHSFRRFVKTTISDLGYQDFSEFFIGHSQSTYWRKPDKEKLELFKKIEPYLTYLDQSGLERKGADLQNRLEVMEQENKGLKGRYEQDMKSMQDKMNQIMEMIQENPKLARVKPEALTRKKKM
jgi:integrase